MEAVLRAALEATGAERAFVVVADGPDGKPRVAFGLSLRSDGLRQPSRTLLQRALAEPRPFLRPHADLAAELEVGHSVRALELRCVLAAPVAWRPPGRAALVLDSRLAPGLSNRVLPPLLEGFAGLASLLAPHLEGLQAPAPLSARRPETTELVGRSPAFLQAMEEARRVAPSVLPVLVIGESGSGKEGFARTVHRLSPRSRAPFLAVNCAAFPDTLLESELFGAVRGAYTGSDRDRPGLFRLAHGGTLFLDEVGDMSPAMQAKLLRVLQDGRVRAVGAESEVSADVRIVAATHRDLAARVAAERFRADLYYRLAVATVRVPPLRERAGDIPLLAAHLARGLETRTGSGPARLAEATIRRLEAHPWPGNVRELETVLARAMLRARGELLEPRHLDLPPTSAPPEQRTVAGPLERSMIESAVAESGGNLARAAARIGWSRQKLYRRMGALGIPRPPRLRD
jgi:DNA-binding NtrC family response regulator